MEKLQVKGKTRIIRDNKISFQTEHDLYCTYKNHSICISEQDSGDYYVTVVDRAGMYAVQGGFGGQYCRYGIKTIEDCLKMCLENIL